MFFFNKILVIKRVNQPYKNTGTKEMAQLVKLLLLSLKTFITGPMWRKERADPSKLTSNLHDGMCAHTTHIKSKNKTKQKPLDMEITMLEEKLSLHQKIKISM